MDTVSMQATPLPGAILVCETCGENFIRGKRGKAGRFCSDKCRKASYAGTCSGCGKPTSGSNGRDKAPPLCMSCVRERRDPFSAAERERGRHISATATRWTVTDMATALHACATDTDLPAGRGPSVKVYTAWQRSHVAPTAVRIVQKFGRWRLAVEAAGLTPARGTQPNHSRVYTAEDCLDAIRQCAAQLGHPPTYREYETFAQCGKPDRTASTPPSGQTIRNTFGPWLDCLRAALR